MPDKRLEPMVRGKPFDGPPEEEETTRGGSPQRRVLAAGMVMLVRVQRLVGVATGGNGMRPQAGAADDLGDRGGIGAGLIEPHVDECMDEIEVEVRDSGSRLERAPDQRRFFGAVHAMHVETQLPHQSSCTAFSTTSVCPSTFTLSQRRATLPLASMR